MTDEEIIAKGFKPICAYPPADWDGGEVLHREGYETTAIDWEAVRYHGSVIGYHPKMPNKIVIPDIGPPEWARVRAKEICERRDSYTNLMAHLIAMIEQEPIDEDLIEARKICQSGKSRNSDVTVDFLSGAHDESFAVQAVLAAIKRGRELGKVGDQDHD